MAIADRKLGSFSVPPVGLGCMVLSHAYGVPPSREQGEAVLQKALDLGIRISTAPRCTASAATRSSSARS